MEASDWTANSYGARIKALRLRSGVGQSALARELETNQSTISRVENGKVPRNTIAKRIVEYIRQNEAQTAGQPDEIIKVLAHSDELRALIVRILVEI